MQDESSVEAIDDAETVDSVEHAASALGAQRAIWIVTRFMATLYGLVIAATFAIHAASAMRQSGHYVVKPLGARTNIALLFIATLASITLAHRMTRRSFSGCPPGELERTLGFTPTSSGWLFGAFAIGVSLAACFVLVSTRLFPVAGQNLGPLVAAAAERGWARHMTAISTVFLAPPTEEFLFRGVLFAGLSRSLTRLSAACVVTLCFIAYHLSFSAPYWPALAAVSLAAIALQVARMRSGSLLPGLVLHMTYNLVLMGTVYTAAP